MHKTGLGKGVRVVTELSRAGGIGW